MFYEQILTLLFLINLTVCCAHDEETTVSGEWKITSVNSRDFYIKTNQSDMSWEFTS